MPPTAYLNFEDVHVEYPGHVQGLRGVSLQVQKGEFVFLVGRTGAGKSTLIKLLTREQQPTQGRVVLQGVDVTGLRASEIPLLRRGMGIVPQDFGLLPRKTVWENVAYAMRAVGHSRREIRLRVPEILDSVSIGHRVDAFPAQLSGGEQQRVAIARALINNPPLLIADEPTGNLDPDLSWEIMELLRRLNQRGTTVLVASHDMMVIHRMGKRIVTLEGGLVLSDEGGPDAEFELVSPDSPREASTPKLSPIEVQPEEAVGTEEVVALNEPAEPETTATREEAASDGEWFDAENPAPAAEPGEAEVEVVPEETPTAAQIQHSLDLLSDLWDESKPPKEERDA